VGIAGLNKGASGDQTAGAIAQNRSSVAMNAPAKVPCNTAASTASLDRAGAVWCAEKSIYPL
jgi:hypothetical protein